MKRPDLRRFMALVFGLTMVSPVSAAGVIMVDPLTPLQAVMPPMPVVVPHVPGQRPVRPPVLKGQVSFGLRLKDEVVKVDINDQVAKTYISQTFSNDTERNLAGTYLFPLPEDTTFSSFSLHIDGRPVEGKILEAQDARRQYEEIVRRLVDPGLLEYADYKTVRARIFPIPAHGTKKVELEYTQLLKADNGLFKYRFPLKAQGQTNAVEEMKLELKLGSKPGLRTIWSPSHTVSVNRSDDHHARVAWMAKDSTPDKDFVLYYSVSDKELSASALSHKAAGEDGYFLVTITPPVQSKNVIGKDLILMADTSGSMQGDKILQCKKALKYVINALNANDRFNVVQFNTDVESFRGGLQVASAENKRSALAFVDGLEASGGTNIGDALKAGAAMVQPSVARPAYLVLMTDGEPTVGETNINRLLRLVDGKKDLRIFDFGVGYDVNTRLLNKLAEENHGTTQYVDPDQDIEAALSAFYQKIKSPVLSKARLVFQGLQVKDVYPKEVKDIFAGGQVLLLGRYKNGAKGGIQLSGTVNGELKNYSFPLVLSAEESAHTYLPRLWAMRRIAHLTEVAQENGNQKEVVDEIVSLSKRFGIISAYTSYLVTDPGELQPAPRVGRVSGSPLLSAAVRGRTRSSLLSIPVPGPVPIPQSVMPMSDLSGRLSPQADTGKIAYLKSKQLVEYKASESEDRALSKNEAVKAVEDKTFYLQHGFWTDSSYSQGKSPIPEVITFGSRRYFELLRLKPALAKYLAIGQQVIVLYQGHSYKIVAPGAKLS